jgi:hypothetical protein
MDETFLRFEISNVRFWPRVCKNAHGLIVLAIDVRWLSDYTVSATACIGNDLEHVNAVLQPLGWAKTGLFKPTTP